jgi:hypothetical protein
VCTAASTLLSLPGRYITVAWDPSPDQLVVGYAVYVGTAPGHYDKAFIVRNRTYFTYADAVPDRPYYFAVVAYTDSLVSNLSQEVSGYGQSTPALPVSGDLAIPDASNALATLNSTHSLICSDRGASDCHSTSIVATTERSIDALAGMGDGRLLIVEESRRIRIFDGHVLSNDVALEASRGVTFIGIAVDPRLEQRNRIYVAEAERRDDGTREVHIVRYRDVQDTLGEPAVIVGGIHLPETGSAPFTVDSNGRIFIAVPSVQAEANGSAAVVLGFESDGSALRFNRAASPIVALAPAAPAAIAWDDSADQLWLTGIEGVAPTVVRVPVHPLTGSDVWPRVPQRVSAVSLERVLQHIASARNSEPASGMVLKTGPGGGLVRVLPDANEFAEVPQSGQEETTATSFDPRTKSTYVATRLKFGATSHIYKIEGW